MVKTRFPVRLLLAALAAGLLSCAGAEQAERPPRTFLRLPFQGAWSVLADEGGILLFRPAIVGIPPEDPGSGNDRFPSWDRPVLVPASGIVVAVVDDLPDHAAGEPDPDHPRGNHVVIRHRPDEFSVLGNLRRGSVRVEPGDDVFPGHVVGRIGNSGNADEPGLRFELLDAPHGRPVPVAFRMYESDGRRRAVGFPRTGDVVRSLWVGVAVPDTTR